MGRHGMIAVDEIAQKAMEEFGRRHLSSKSVRTQLDKVNRPRQFYKSLLKRRPFLGLRDYYEIQGLAFVAVVVDQIRRRVWEKVSSLKKGYSLPEYLLKMRGVKVHRNSSSWTAENLTAKLVAELGQMGVSTDWGKRYLVPPTPKN